ncbi:unnamed protein product, partial [Durusdinium trenchii]
MSRLLVAAVFVCPAWAGNDGNGALSAATAASMVTLLVGMGTLVAANFWLKKKSSAELQAKPEKEETCKHVRTAADAPMPPDEALKLLKEGNARFIKGEPQATRTNKAMRKQLVDMGQAPHTAIIGCADSRAPLETIFDTMPGDIFVLRNAGNTCTHAEGSMVGSLEFCTGKLGARMILVLGHTKCGAVYGATNAYLEAKKKEVSSVNSALEGLLLDLAPVAEKAVADMGVQIDAEEVAAHAVEVNVFHTINFLLKYSAPIREKVKSGQVEIQGGIYHLDT